MVTEQWRDEIEKAIILIKDARRREVDFWDGSDKHYKAVSELVGAYNTAIWALEKMLGDYVEDKK